MPHTRREIIDNQNTFRNEIVGYLKSEFQKSKKDLSKIETVDERIIQEKEKLIKTTNKLKIIKEIDKLFISEKYIYPKYIAWWNEETNEVQIEKNTNQ